MPKIVKTVRSSESNPFNIYANPTSVEMFAKALGQAVGSGYKTVTDESDPNLVHTRHYVLMDNVGYPGWAIVISSEKESGNNWTYMDLNIVTVSENTPNFVEEHRISQIVKDVSLVYNRFTNYETTCSIYMDNSKDTVLINIHPGSSETAADIADQNYDNISLSFFFAKDVKNSVLCGLGWSHIAAIRTTDASCNVLPLETVQIASLSDVLHLTKMVNYLSPEKTEMKTAYVSVMTPMVTNVHAQNPSFYIDGYGRFSSIGFADPNNGKFGWHGTYLYPPFQPFVKY